MSPAPGARRTEGHRGVILQRGVGAMSDPMDHSSSSVADGFVIPGERLAPAGSWKAGRGTYLFQGHIFASVVGLKQEVPPADASSPLQVRACALARPALPPMPVPSRLPRPAGPTRPAVRRR